MRVPLLGAALLVALTATGSQAAGCPLVTDPARDQTVDMPGLDILSADLGVTADDVTAVVRLRDITGSHLPGTGSAWNLVFNASGTRYRLSASTDLSGTRFGVHRFGPGTTNLTAIGTASGTIDPVTEEVTIVAPRSVFGSPLADGNVVTSVLVYTQAVVGAHGAATSGFDVDTATGGGFVVGDPGCLA